MIAEPFDARLIAPLGAEAPFGRDLTYEPGFQELQAEVDQATALSGRPVDWERVRSASTQLLVDESKDMRLASWWCVASAHLDGWSGLLRGLALYHALLAGHWEGMFPPAKRARARAGLVEWVWENARKALAARDVASAEVTTVRDALSALSSLDLFLSERLGEVNPGVGTLRSLLREKASSVPEAALGAAPVVTAERESAAPAAVAPAPEQAVAIAPAPRPPAAPPPANLAAPAAPAVATNGDVQQAATRWREPLFSLAAAARGVDPGSPLSYRLARTAAWLAVEGPPDVEGGKTFLRAPHAGDVQDLRALFTSGQWTALRDASEAALADHLFWLDLNFFTYCALDQLGPAFAPARATVVRETLALLDRVPALESLRFRDGSPFASADTVAWLQTKRAGTAKPHARSSDGEKGEEGEVETLVAAARSACTEGNANDALAAALLAIASLPGARARFRARLDVAVLALDQRRTAVGLAALEQLVGEVDATLEAWEPSLCAAALAAYLRASAFQAQTAADPRLSLLFGRLLQLDPVSALRISGAS